MISIPQSKTLLIRLLRCSAVWLLLVAGAAAIAGCRTDPPSAATNLRLTEDEEQMRLTLNRRQQQAVRAALAAVAEGHEPIDPPAAAPAGMCWSDVPNALRMACDEVEMAVFGKSGDEDFLVFNLRTVDDRPGRFVITRRDDDRIYDAHATFGRFEDDTAKAEKLLDAFHEAMKSYGAKRRIKSPYE